MFALLSHALYNEMDQWQSKDQSNMSDVSTAMED